MSAIETIAVGMTKCLFVAVITITVIFCQDAELRYNRWEDEWEYAAPDAELRYNHHEDQWEYADPYADLRYNYWEDVWEHIKTDNVFEYSDSVLFQNNWPDQ